MKQNFNFTGKFKLNSNNQNVLSNSNIDFEKAKRLIQNRRKSNKEQIDSIRNDHKNSEKEITTNYTLKYENQPTNNSSNKNIHTISFLDTNNTMTNLPTYNHYNQGSPLREGKFLNDNYNRKSQNDVNVSHSEISIEDDKLNFLYKSGVNNLSYLDKKNLMSPFPFESDNYRKSPQICYSTKNNYKIHSMNFNHYSNSNYPIKSNLNIEAQLLDEVSSLNSKEGKKCSNCRELKRYLNLNMQENSKVMNENELLKEQLQILMDSNEMVYKEIDELRLKLEIKKIKDENNISKAAEIKINELNSIIKQYKSEKTLLEKQLEDMKNQVRRIEKIFEDVKIPLNNNEANEKEKIKFEPEKKDISKEYEHIVENQDNHSIEEFSVKGSVPFSFKNGLKGKDMNMNNFIHTSKETNFNNALESDRYII